MAAQTLKKLDKWATLIVLACAVTNFCAWQSSDLTLFWKIVVALTCVGLFFVLSLFLQYNDYLTKQEELKRIFG